MATPLLVNFLFYIRCWPAGTDEFAEREVINGRKKKNSLKMAAATWCAIVRNPPGTRIGEGAKTTQSARKFRAEIREPQKRLPFKAGKLYSLLIAFCARVSRFVLLGGTRFHLRWLRRGRLWQYQIVEHSRAIFPAGNFRKLLFRFSMYNHKHTNTKALIVLITSVRTAIHRWFT